MMKILVKTCIWVLVIFITLICKRQHGGDYQFRSDSGSFAAIFLMGALARGGGEVINILLSPATNFHCISININQYWHDWSNLIPAMRWFFKLSKTLWKYILNFSNQIMDEGRIMSLISNYSWTSQKEQGIVYEGVGLSLSLMMSKLIPSLLCFVGKLFCPQFHADLGCLSRSG